ncbi:MAG TPA: prolyl oligopeptidase family serine peptidase [Aliidongia sp.]|uniref:prolyl oligopeptidase family serine peptidase n=1 Tax=Aliidongia sp. TaxID=1914230 RepID=UPI002DDCEDCB|nr:prolyl oligopeptidase family serine peptidase [Aliidongia sp.]HEV2674231.1 prolyl oligopeptidase family serine peptidase [Aliidongia sp.]
MALRRDIRATMGGLTLGLAALIATGTAMAAPGQPVADKKPVTENFFGTSVTDDYRWMEDSKSPQFQAFMKGQADYTEAALARIPGRAALEKRIVALDNASVKVLGVDQVGDAYFYRKSAPGAVNYSLVVRIGAKGKEKVLVDPTRLSTAGKHVSIDYFQPSLDGKYVAYGLSEGGSEQSVLHVMDVATGKDLGEHIDRTNDASVSWLPDNKSFYYNRLKKLDAGAPGTDKYKDSRAYLHVLGTDAESDKPVLGTGLGSGLAIDPIAFPFVIVTPGSDYALGLVQNGVQNEVGLYAAPLDKVVDGNAPWVKLALPEDEVTGAALHGHDLFLLTHKDAARFRVLKEDVSKPDLAQAQVAVPAGTTVITGVATAADALYIQDMDGGPSRLRRLPYDTGIVEAVPLAYDGATIDGLYTDTRVPGALFSVEGWVHSAAWVTYVPKDRKIVDTGLLAPSPVDTRAYAAEEIKIKSADGTDVPLSIVRRKDAKPDGKHPTLIWGYGAYGVSETPVFSPRRLALEEHNGIWAICHVRGGGEYGEDWHLAGKKATKPNSWADLIACAQYLIDKGWTSSAMLGIEGGSAGGILVGNAMATRPDLFRVVLDDVGVSNALRGEFSENGPPNIPEFGTVTAEDGFKGLLAIDAMHNIKPGTAYPAVLLTTGINDPRVPSYESAKMAATLQAATTSGRPILLRVDYDAGHGIGSTRVQANKELADKYAFAFWQMGLPGYQPKAK